MDCTGVQVSSVKFGCEVRRRESTPVIRRLGQRAPAGPVMAPMARGEENF